MAADPAGFGLKDALAIGVSVISLGVTILWNIANRRHTNRVARELRSESYDLEGWQTQRSAIVQSLRAFEDASSNLIVLSIGGHSFPDLVAAISAANLQLVQKHVALIRELDRADFEPSWVPLANGRDGGDETDWDLLNNVLAEAATMTDADLVRAHIKLIAGHTDGIAATINAAVNQRNLSLHPGNGLI